MPPHHFLRRAGRCDLPRLQSRVSNRCLVGCGCRRAARPGRATPRRVVARDRLPAVRRGDWRGGCAAADFAASGRSPAGVFPGTEDDAATGPGARERAGRFVAGAAGAGVAGCVGGERAGRDGPGAVPVVLSDDPEGELACAGRTGGAGRLREEDPEAYRQLRRWHERAVAGASPMRGPAPITMKRLRHRTPQRRRRALCPRRPD